MAIAAHANRLRINALKLCESEITMNGKRETPRITRSTRASQLAQNKRTAAALNVANARQTRLTSCIELSNPEDVENKQQTITTNTTTAQDNLNVCENKKKFKTWLDTNRFNLIQADEPKQKLLKTPQIIAKCHQGTGASNVERNVSKVKILDNGNWMQYFEPVLPDEVAVHSKKLTELNNWFKHCHVMHARTPAQLCLMTGPTGAAKTAAVKVLAKANQYQIMEWINPLEQDFGITIGEGRDVTFGESQLDTFKSFLFRASRYQSLLERQQKRLLLVEDFPNKLLNDATAFESILSDYKSFGKSPLVFIVTDSKSRGLNISYNLFSDQLQSKYGIVHISFNAIADTFMQSAMKRFCRIIAEQSANYRVPTQAIIDSIVASAQGDIRNALISLHFAALKGAPTPATQQLQNLSAAAAKRKKQTTLKSIGCDDSTNLMHALGRVFNPKYTAEQRLLHNPEAIAEAFSTQSKTFLDFVHANYLEHFREIEHVTTAAEGMSSADVLMREYRDDNLPLTALTLGVRSVMIANKQPISGWLPVRSAKRMQNISPFNEELRSMGVQHNVSKSLYIADYKSYLKIIMKASSKA